MHFTPQRYRSDRARERTILRLISQKSAARRRKDWKRVEELERELRALEG